jgi:hypothetical protein
MSGTLTDIKAECQSYGNFDPDYYRKMMHRIPDAPVVNREQFILERCDGKRVFSLGATGPMQEAVDAVASQSYGTDMELVSDDELARKTDFVVLDLDGEDWTFPDWKVDLVVCGETIEHLTNPGRVLKALKKFGCDLIITVPNAFGVGGISWVGQGVEHVNVDHVAWYSYATMRQLLKRTGYEVVQWCWYNGQPMTAEGLIFVVR